MILFILSDPWMPQKFLDAGTVAGKFADFWEQPMAAAKPSHLSKPRRLRLVTRRTCGT
jgi:hypothetical protein